MKKLKTNLSNVVFQSQFLPLVQKAETEIKKLVEFYTFTLKSKHELRIKIKGIIKAVEQRLPISLYDRSRYIKALYDISEKMIKEFYDVLIPQYYNVYGILRSMGIEVPQKQLMDILKNPTNKKYLASKNLPNLYAKAKGTPYISNYGQLVKERINKLAETQTTSDKGISLWQKAEIDIRHENQMSMLQEMKDSGVRYAFTSSHPDCSKRCSKWQGKLFDIVAEKSELSGFRMRKKIDGHTVYCLNEVISQVDKYGYTNNIIVGFNCRHHLISYNGQVPPDEYTEQEIKEQRAINSKLREMEREIRLHKQKSILYNSSDPKLAQEHKNKAKVLTEKYKKYAESKGYAWYDYRIKV